MGKTDALVTSYPAITASKWGVVVKYNNYPIEPLALSAPTVVSGTLT